MFLQSKEICLDIAWFILYDTEEALSILSRLKSWFLYRSIDFISGVMYGGSVEQIVIVLSG